MNILDAAYRVGHDHPGGATALAAKLGKNPATFLAELDPGQKGHKLGLGDAVPMQLLAQDFRILQAMAMALGHAVVPLPGGMDVRSNDELYALMVELLERQGDFAHEFRRAYADFHFTRREADELRALAHRWLSVIVELTRRIDAMAARNLPAPLPT